MANENEWKRQQFFHVDTIKWWIWIWMHIAHAKRRYWHLKKMQLPKWYSTHFTNALIGKISHRNSNEEKQKWKNRVRIFGIASNAFSSNFEISIEFWLNANERKSQKNCWKWIRLESIVNFSATWTRNKLQKQLTIYCPRQNEWILQSKIEKKKRKKFTILFPLLRDCNWFHSIVWIVNKATTKDENSNERKKNCHHLNSKSTWRTRQFFYDF